ncbi:MAG: EAL domain-containing protein [Pigmentiphaga sp.]|uniref:sensor domain-containing protein n=1 Tax=Pigmentiphaga sp. TaxID=1977564 RepID=UPI0029BE844D|nr:EAL domain-containing protein [Pigmentiphaga sp.]MDX3904572.1 EAL domain-containing protein [Pigmentiphaga sp.]
MQIDADTTTAWSAQQLTATAYRLAIQSAPCGMFVCDAHGIFTMVNPAYERITGYSAQQLVGRRRFEDLHDPSEAAVRRIELINPPTRDVVAVQPGEPLTANQGAEADWTYIRRNGARITVTLSLARLAHADGRTAGYVGAVFDSSRRHRDGLQLWHLLHHDPLTGLPNQELLEERLGLALERAKARNEPVLLVLVELDNLRKLRDTLGQAAADAAVKQVAARLKRLCGDDHMLGLMRDSLFAMISCGHQTLSAEREAALLAEVARPIPFAPATLHLTASVGVSSYPTAGNDPRALLQRALLALTAASRSGGGTARHFDFGMQTQSVRRSHLETLLREAVDTQQFSLAFQPQVDLHSGRITRAETLLRWRHPQLGAIGPDEFVPLAEDLGLMDQIGSWVLDAACQQTVRLFSKFGRSPCMAINVSPTQLRDRKFYDMVSAALERWRLPAGCIELEITEGLLLDHSRQVVDTLHALRKLGVEVAIDDFGTGYASIAYLTRFPFNRIKIDRSLVRAISSVKNGDAIISAIIGMAHALGIKVTAEGVETAAHAGRLAELGCDEAQGFWFSRPLTAQALENALSPIA